MFNIKRIYDRNEAVWNKPWEINKELEMEMFMEEFDETNQAYTNQDLVEIADWLIDMVFVYGWTLMKLWYTLEEVNSEFWDFIGIDEAVASYNHWLENDDKKLLIQWFQGLIDVVYRELMSKWVSMRNITRCFDEICDSNDSKLPFEKNAEWKVIKWKSYRKPELLPLLTK